jgi:hypothetical protein
MKAESIGGMYAAALTPRLPDGRIDRLSFQHELEFLLANQIHGFALNGATGEFCLTTEADAEILLQATADTLSGRGKFLFGIGSASSHRAIALATMALSAGAEGVLLPVPYFFRYAQDDLATFCRSVAERVAAPVLLYNLPQFATGLECSTVCELIVTCENIVGIKESGDSLARHAAGDYLHEFPPLPPARKQLACSSWTVIQKNGNIITESFRAIRVGPHVQLLAADNSEWNNGILSSRRTCPAHHEAAARPADAAAWVSLAGWCSPSDKLLVRRVPGAPSTRRSPKSARPVPDTGDRERTAICFGLTAARSEKKGLLCDLTLVLQVLYVFATGMSLCAGILHGSD